jgi:hypothetical protein
MTNQALGAESGETSAKRWGGITPAPPLLHVAHRFFISSEPAARFSADEAG